MAAAEAPASPEPTMMISYLRRLAGLTSRVENRCRSHFSASGPGGTLASREIVAVAGWDSGGCGHPMIPSCTAMGTAAKPAVTTQANTVAKPRRQVLKRGLLIPMLWNMLQAPCQTWSERAPRASR